MKKVLFYADSPTIETGFAQVSKNILDSIIDGYEVEVVATNCAKKAKGLPYVLHPCPQGDLYNLKLIIDKIRKGDFDILFTLNNFGVIANLAPFVEEIRKKKKIKWINYAPLDNEVFFPEEAPAIILPDVCVVYTKFARKVIKDLTKRECKYIYHGTDTELFKPVSVSERAALKKELWGVKPTTIIVTNVNRNQWRKDLPRTMAAFKVFQQYLKSQKQFDAKLYLHAKQNDQGGDLLRQALQLGFNPDKEIIIPKINDVTKGVSREKMAKIYQASDLVVSSALGEGWGLSLTEAMACGTPVLFPNNSSMTEIIGENTQRGFFIAKGGWTISHGNCDLLYPNIDYDDMGKQMFSILFATEPKVVQIKLNNARKFAQANSWTNIKKEWRKVFDEV